MNTAPAGVPIAGDDVHHAGQAIPLGIRARYVCAMPRSTEQLSVGEWAVLGLLAEEPTHGFAVARAMAPDGEIGKVWSLPRPRVYHAIDGLTEKGLIEPVGTVASRTGPRRTVLRITPSGRRAVTKWLRAPVQHVRDARSLFLLKLLFLERGARDREPLLRAQRKRFDALADRLATTISEADGFDRTLLRWRLETTTAAVRFIDTLTDSPQDPLP
jgi:DNA-binding PadR family transcriptional regulator